MQRRSVQNVHLVRAALTLFALVVTLLLSSPIKRSPQVSSVVSIADLCRSREILEQSGNSSLIKAHANRPMQVYIGASICKRPPGFISFEEHELDVTVPSHFSRIFCTHSVDTFLTEHTFEHISYKNGLRAFKLFYEYLKPGGLLRIAVPNDHTRQGRQIGELHVDKNYGHVAAYGTEFLKKQLEIAGFSSIFLVEEKVSVNRTTVRITTAAWNSGRGMIYRSFKHDWRNSNALRVLYPHLNLDELGQIGSNEMYFTTAGPLKNTALLNPGTEKEVRVEVFGTPAELLFKNAAPTSDGLDVATKLECIDKARRGTKAMRNTLVGFPPVTSLIVDAYK